MVRFADCENLGIGTCGQIIQANYYQFLNILNQSSYTVISTYSNITCSVGLAVFNDTNSFGYTFAPRGAMAIISSTSAFPKLALKTNAATADYRMDNFSLNLIDPATNSAIYLAMYAYQLTNRKWLIINHRSSIGG